MNKVSCVLSHPDERQLALILESMYARLKEKAQDLLSKATGQAVLYGVSCDGTPLRATSTVVRTSGGQSICRKGKVLHEFLLQRGFLLAHSGGSGEKMLAILLHDVLLMDDGKKAGN